MLSQFAKINYRELVKPERIKPGNCLVIDGITINIVRTRRKKTIALNIRDGEVSVLVPQRTRLSHIKTIVTEKSNWIQQKLLQQENQTPRFKHQYEAGESFLYLGTERILKIVTACPKTYRWMRHT